MEEDVQDRRSEVVLVAHFHQILHHQHDLWCLAFDLHFLPRSVFITDIIKQRLPGPQNIIHILKTSGSMKWCVNKVVLNREAVSRKINSLQVKNSAGPDNIHPKLLRVAGDTVIPSLVSLQWAYRKGYSTELLLTQLTELWRKELDKGKAIAMLTTRPNYIGPIPPVAIRGSLITWVENHAY
ncbi:hypothetical protein pdam_00005940 [Pocillopora damicornis]|uniref:Uncharacterized protein n=1 Tax=Pocillopora damicornis TaxID=46731 RepID=A0A3M6TBG8_POCDA|nr:hypothetical protein pdam_00005940 [Pocillopora damicornis]